MDKKYEREKELVIKVLKGDPGYTQQILNRVEKKMARQTFFTLRNRLVRAKVIIKEKVGA